MRNIMKILRQWKNEARSTSVILFKYFRKDEKLVVYTSQPGLLIGLHGKMIDKYTPILMAEKYPKIKKVELVETESYYV